MNCQHCIDFLDDFLAGALAPAERTVFEEHFAACPDCVAYLHMYGKTVKLGKAAYQEDDPAGRVEIPEDLIRAILAARPHPGAPGTP